MPVQQVVAERWVKLKQDSICWKAMALPSVRRWSALTHMILIIMVVASVLPVPSTEAKLLDDDDNEIATGSTG